MSKTATETEEKQTMQVVIHSDRKEPAKETSAAQARMLLWASAGLLETLCLLGGIYWIMSANDPRPLALRVSLVAALAVLCGIGTLVAYVRFGRER
jgi:hypothetical protein